MCTVFWYIIILFLSSHLLSHQGKTLGFLIPTIDALLKIRPDENSIRCLVLSPTRELAVQISTEAHALLTYHRGMRVVTVVGGTNINTDKKNMSGKVDFLVATPGRLIDHLENTPDFSARCTKTLTHLIFDEADQLLDMGFRPEIEKILRYMPQKVTIESFLLSLSLFSLRLSAMNLNTIIPVLQNYGENLKKLSRWRFDCS